MTGREWKPGEVVTWDREGGRPLRLFRETFGYQGDGEPRWISDTEGQGYPGPVANLRPLVVIDPEDRDQVARLVVLLGEHGWRPTEAHGLRAALREFADPKPPKPDEPTGWGAVVEDRDGWYWTLVAPDSAAWANYGHNGYRKWSEVDAVRVLSEGVQP